MTHAVSYLKMWTCVSDVSRHNLLSAEGEFLKTTMDSRSMDSEIIFLPISIVVIKRKCIQALNIYRQGQYIALEDLSHICAITANQKSKILKAQMQKEGVTANHTLGKPHSSASTSVIHKQYQNRKNIVLYARAPTFSALIIYMQIFYWNKKYIQQNIWKRTQMRNLNVIYMLR